MVSFVIIVATAIVFTIVGFVLAVVGKATYYKEPFRSKAYAFKQYAIESDDYDRVAHIGRRRWRQNLSDGSRVVVDARCLFSNGKDTIRICITGRGNYYEHPLRDAYILPVEASSARRYFFYQGEGLSFQLGKFKWNPQRPVFCVASIAYNDGDAGMIIDKVKESVEKFPDLVSTRLRNIVMAR